MDSNWALSGSLTMPVKDDMTAAPPVNNIAVTRILVMMPKTVKTLENVRIEVQYLKRKIHGVLQMRNSSKSGLDNFKESMGIRSTSLKLNRNTGKE
jgi:hypothetical protein